MQIKNSKNNKGNLKARQLINLIKNKIIYVLGALFFIMALSIAASIWQFGLIPLKHYTVANIKLHSKFIDIDENLDLLGRKMFLIIYYEKVKPLNYRNKLKQTLNETEILVKKIDSGYKNTEAFIKKTAPYANYDPKIVKIFEKSYFQWKTVDRPIFKRFIKYSSYISARTTYGSFILFNRSFHSLILPLKTLVKNLPYFEHIFNIDLLTFAIGTVFILILGILLAYYLDKFFNAMRESEELFRTLADNMPEGLDMHTEKFIYANPALQAKLGYSEEELKNMFFWDILAEEHKETAKDAIKKGLVDIDYKHYVTFKVFKKTGEELWMYIYAGSALYKGKRVRIATFTDITELVQLRKQLEKEKESYKNISEKDDLTGIFNRRKFKSSLERLIKIAARYKRPLSLVMFDIDRFKEINDNFGHQAGDSVLRELTALVGTTLRDTDILARYGGEEFMVIMPETDINDAENIAERIRKSVENHIFKYTTSVTISLGVGRYADGEDADGFIKRVDGALYKAKQGGRNRVCIV